MINADNDHRLFHLRPTTFPDRLVDRLRFPSCYRDKKLAPSLDAAQRDCVARLRRDGFVMLPGHIPVDRLNRMKDELECELRGLRFETPCLAQSRVDPRRDSDLIANYMYASTAELQERGLAFSEADCSSYDQVIADFNPSTLTAYMLEKSAEYQAIWFDPFVLGIVVEYLGMVPRMAEAYVRRNFPSPHRTMNHFWHRDLNHKHFLLKAFIFLTDCAVDNGPHEFIRGSQSKFDPLNNKRYYDDGEVDALYPVGSPDRIVSEVRAGTVIIEDTRGLHRARMPERGFRDLGYAVFMPLRESFSETCYTLPRAGYEALTPFQRAFVPARNVV